MPATTVVRVYAETLLRLAEGEGAIDEVTGDLEALERAMVSEERFRRFLEAPQIRSEEKRSVLAAALEGHVHPATGRFLDLVVRKHREPLLPEIAAAWRGILDRRANRQSATVTTAVPADPGTLDRLRSALERATGKSIVLEERVNPTLLGGLVVRTGDLVMDASLRARLVGLRQRLRGTRAAGA